MIRKYIVIAAALFLSISHAAWAQPVEAPRPSTSNAAVAVDAGIRRHVLIVCGHPGDETFQVEFREAVDAIAKNLIERWGVAESDLHVLFGQGSAGQPPADRDALAAEAKQLVAVARPDDAVWVIVVGHAHYDGRRSWLNLPGDDIEQAEFAQLFESLTAKEQVFFLAFPVSGYYTRLLSRDGRTVITATEADLELNATYFPGALAEVLGTSPPAMADADTDGQRTLLDLYIEVARKVADRFTANEAIPTEHAQLDDDGDGRGTELQLDYLPAEQGGRFDGTPPPPRSSGDGRRAAQILLPVAAE
jgi:hypothetical protein